MSIVKIPKKMRNILADIRNGQVPNGLELLDSFKGFEPQKALVKAEINYFRGNYEEALTCDEQALPFDEQWYAGNMLTEHLFAYSQAARTSKQVPRATRFLEGFLAAKKELSLPAHRIAFYEHQVYQHISLLQGEQNLPILPAPLFLLAAGKPLEDFTAQLTQYRPKLSLASAAGADYLLHFVFQRVATGEALHYYSTYADQLSSEDHHLTAARLYMQLNQPEQARQAILRFSAITWHPVDFLQVTPMRLWEFDDLQPIMTRQFKEELLALPKAR